MLEPNSLLHNRYRIVQLIGEGGMGAVYEAVDQSLSNRVALKQTLVSGAQYVKAFEREAQLLARLRHPALPKVIDHFVDASGQFLVMEFITGVDLATLLDEQAAPFSADVVIEWADQLLNALEYLHSQQPPVIHRDIKPQNLKLTPEGQIILLDFGLAKGAATAQAQSTSARSVFGYTPQYAAPEQFYGSGTNQCSDLYALAATLYCLLTGSPPVNAMQRSYAIGSRQPDPLRPAHEVNPQVPQPISAVLTQAMALSPDKRPADAATMRALLRDAHARRGKAPASRRWIWPAAGGAAALLAAVAVLAGVVFLRPATTPGVATATSVQSRPGADEKGIASADSATDTALGSAATLGATSLPAPTSPRGPPDGGGPPAPPPPLCSSAAGAAPGQAIGCYAPDLQATLLRQGYENSIVTARGRRGLGTQPGGDSLWSRDLDYAISGYGYALADMSVLKESIELFLKGVKDGVVPDQVILNQAQPYVYDHRAWDSMPNLIHAAYIYVAKTGDHEFYQAHRDELEQIGGWIAALDADGDGLPDQERDTFPYGYYNSVENGVRHTYALAKFYAAFNELAELERYAGRDGGAWGQRAGQLRAGFHSQEGGYWPAGQPWPLAWFRPDNTPVNVLETFGVFEALRSGLIAPSDGERYQALIQALHERLPDMTSGPNPLRLALGGYPPEVLRRDVKVPPWMLNASVPWAVGVAAPAYAAAGHPDDARALLAAYTALAERGPLRMFADQGQQSREAGGSWDSSAWFLAVYGGHYGLALTPGALIVHPRPFEARQPDGVGGLLYQGASVSLALDATRNLYSIRATKPLHVILQPLGGATLMRLDGGPPQPGAELDLQPGHEYVVISEGQR